jgi:hypothetical protein
MWWQKLKTCSNTASKYKRVEPTQLANPRLRNTALHTVTTFVAVLQLDLQHSCAKQLCLRWTEECRIQPIRWSSRSIKYFKKPEEDNCACKGLFLKVIGPLLSGTEPTVTISRITSGSASVRRNEGRLQICAHCSGANLCVPRPLDVNCWGIRGVGSVHTVNIVSQRQYFVARSLSSYVDNVWFTQYMHLLSYMQASDVGETHSLVPTTVSARPS